MFIIIFFLIFLSNIFPIQSVDGNFVQHNQSHQFASIHQPHCEHMSKFKTKGYLVFKVSLRGCGNFISIQKAIDAIPISNRKKLILVDSGIYWERVIIPENKSNIVMQGMGYLNTYIQWNNTAATYNSASLSFSVAILGENFTAFNISFKNTAPPPNKSTKDGQAVALKVVGDKVAFYGCGFFSYQDTLQDQEGRHFYKNCFIEGSIDFIFGNARSLYQDCTINSVAKEHTIGCITANARNLTTDRTGFVFVNCKIKGSGRVWLGRAYRAFGRVVFSKTYMSRVVSFDGWNDMNFPERQRTVYYGEHRCYGPGANQSKRVAYAKQLTDAEAAPFISESFIDGKEWLKNRAI